MIQIETGKGRHPMTGEVDISNDGVVTADNSAANKFAASQLEGNEIKAVYKNEKDKLTGVPQNQSAMFPLAVKEVVLRKGGRL